MLTTTANCKVNFDIPRSCKVLRILPAHILVDAAPMPQAVESECRRIQDVWAKVWVQFKPKFWLRKRLVKVCVGMLPVNPNAVSSLRVAPKDLVGIAEGVIDTTDKLGLRVCRSGRIWAVEDEAGAGIRQGHDSVDKSHGNWIEPVDRNNIVRKTGLNEDLAGSRHQDTHLQSRQRRSVRSGSLPRSHG